MGEEKKTKFKFKKETVITLAIGLVIGAIVGLGVMYFIHPSKSIASVNGKIITEKQIYNKLQKYYSSDVLTMILEEVDTVILSKKYEEDEKMKSEIEEIADKYIDSYISYYGGTQEEFLEECGFEGYDDFMNYLSLEYRRNLYYYDYLAKIIGEEKIKEYYDANNFGQIDVKHILVRTSEDMSEKESQNIAKEIITKLNEGADFDTIGEEYKEQYGETIVIEDLGYLGLGDSIEEAFMEALKAMENKTYSSEPVKTSYGHHIIYRKDSKDLSVEDARNDIINVLYSDVEAKSQDEKLIELRKEAGLKFNAEKFQVEYDEMCANYVTEEDD